MNFQRGKNIKEGIGIGIEKTYHPLRVEKSFKIRYRLKGCEGQLAQSLFGSERGHEVLKLLEEEHPDREKLHELTAIKTPIVELFEIRFRYSPEKNDGKYMWETDLPYELSCTYELDAWMTDIIMESIGEDIKLPFRNDKIEDLPIIFDGQLYFIKVINVF